MSCHGVNDHSVCHCRRRARQFRHDEAVHTIRDHFADGSVAKAVHHNRWRKPCALSDKQQTLARARLAEGQSVAAKPSCAYAPVRLSTQFVEVGTARICNRLQAGSRGALSATLRGN